MQLEKAERETGLIGSNAQDSALQEGAEVPLEEPAPAEPTESDVYPKESLTEDAHQELDLQMESLPTESESTPLWVDKIPFLEDDLEPLEEPEPAEIEVSHEDVKIKIDAENGTEADDMAPETVVSPKEEQERLGLKNYDFLNIRGRRKKSRH
jgi:hypothetical protein